MKERITTQSGSIYTIDYDAKTWARQKGPEASTLRTDEGTFDSISFIRVDVFDKADSIRMICPPINPPHRRFITSTPIISREVIE